MKKSFIIHIILSSILISGCSYKSKQTITAPISNNTPDYIETSIYDPYNVFSGLWMKTDNSENTYFKFRNNSIEYQSNNTFYFNYDSVTDISFDDMGKNFYIKTIINFEDTTEYSIHINVLDSETINLNGSILKKVNNIESAALDLYNTFKNNNYDDINHSLSSFLDITYEELTLILQKNTY